MLQFSGMEKEMAVYEDDATYGIDVSLLEANLRLTPEQRLRRHDRTLTTIEKLRSAMDKKRG